MQDRTAAKELFSGLAGVLGFSPDPPRTLVSVQPGKVVSALQHGVGSLRPLLLAALLAARDDEQHPLRSLARSDPGFLVQLDDVAGLRDGAAHAGQEDQDRAKSCQKAIEQAVQFAFRVTRTLLFPTT
jgi:hypothetical protein